jgi:hypothetical protein
VSAVEALELVVTTASDDGEDSLTHLVCCDLMIALCGTRMTQGPRYDALADCVVCVELEHAPCTVTCGPAHLDRVTES